MKRRNMKKRIIAQLMAAGLLTVSIPWVPTDMVNATTTSEDSQTVVENQAGEAQQSLEDTKTEESVEAGSNSETGNYAETGADDNSGNTDSSETSGNSESTDNSEVPDTDANTTTDTDKTDTETIADPTPGSNARGVMEQPAANARYDGITIDGDFSDWDAVAKYDVNQSGLDQAAMVWDGDMIYLYFMTLGNENGNGNWNEVTWSGPNSNGNFAITTDLGNTLKFQLCNDGTVAGVDGASAAVNNKDWEGAPHMWEVSIPSSVLPAYKNTISLGWYAADILISDIANLKGDNCSDTGNSSDSGSGTGGNTGTDSGNAGGIAIDGNYGEWENYPHNLIQYSTNGSHDSKPDGEAALYMSDGRLYAHVRTEMQSHLSEAGGEFTQAVTIRLNGKHDFYPQFVTVDVNGNINTVSSLSGLEKGTYEVYLIDSQGWQVNGVSLSELMSDDSLDTYHNAIYGHMYMTIGASKDDMEFELDLELVAQKFGMDADDIKTVEAQWGRIGPQLVSAAGTSTGTWLGLLICFAAVGISAQVAKRKKRIAG